VNTLYEEWIRLNEEFMQLDGLKVVASAGVYTSRTRVVLNATGFGAPFESVLLRDKRIDLLRERYVDPDTWDQCYKRFHSQPKGASHTFLFNRKGDRPKAGGCLLSIVLCKADKDYEVMITSRALEATMAMMADMQFIYECLVQIKKDLGLVLDLDTCKIMWCIGVVHQNRVFVPVFFYDTRGATGFRKWLKSKARNKWEQINIDHAVKMVRNEGVTGARAMWGKRLRKWVYERYGIDYP
jgi:hypothetical protein